MKAENSRFFRGVIKASTTSRLPTPSGSGRLTLATEATHSFEAGEYIYGTALYSLYLCMYSTPVLAVWIQSAVSVVTGLICANPREGLSPSPWLEVSTSQNPAAVSSIA